jgi:hypothetical protein
MEKPPIAFHKKAASKDGLQSACKECNGYVVKQWQKDNPEAYEAIWKRNSYGPEAVLKRKASRYGITVDELKSMIDRADGKCEICRRNPRQSLVIDHCHTKGNVRGLICEKCNQALGLFADDIDSLKRAINYLNK